MKVKRVNERISMDFPRLTCPWLTWLLPVMRTWVSSVPSQQRRPTVYMACKLREVYIHLCSERCTVSDSTIEDTGKLEQIQQRDTKIIRRLEHWHTRRWKSCLFSLKKRRLNRISLRCPQWLHLVLRRARLFSGVHSKGKRDRCKLQQGKLWLDIRDRNHSEGNLALEKIGRRGGEVSSIEDI